jgi:hypothetical protein
MERTGGPYLNQAIKLRALTYTVNGHILPDITYEFSLTVLFWWKGLFVFIFNLYFLLYYYCTWDYNQKFKTKRDQPRWQLLTLLNPVLTNYTEEGRSGDTNGTHGVP